LSAGIAFKCFVISFFVHRNTYFLSLHPHLHNIFTTDREEDIPHVAALIGMSVAMEVDTDVATPTH
jgi:hypothetical protein